MGEVERDAHYANKQTEDDDDEVSRWGRWPVFCANTRELRKMIEVGDLIDVPQASSIISISSNRDRIFRVNHLVGIVNELTTHIVSINIQA